MFEKWKRKSSTENKKIQIASPLTGQAVLLKEAPDEAFAAGYMGPGIAIVPQEGRLVAPFDGLLAHVFKTKHAVIIEHSSGIQLLLHIGMDTVSLKGQGFTAHVETGQEVKAGQLLIEFDIDFIKEAGYPVITPVVFSNANEVPYTTEWTVGSVQAGKDIISIATCNDS